ncbi:Rieske (2Fe-2S) protein [Caulobacter sp. DWR1-3-2b1]|uniref:Rieske (2Fe-2S) protein n=1 Tax=Caulobacter sp. DWR1-3-2b1 TaxID=2804670 RepID=UPI003CFBC1C8
MREHGEAAQVTEMTELSFTAVATASEIAPETAKEVKVNGRSILICHSDGRFFAVENRCSHAEEPLACGRLKRGWLSCPAHGARFDLETGEPLNPPATEPIATFVIRINGDVIEVAA